MLEIVECEVRAFVEEDLPDDVHLERVYVAYGASAPGLPEGWMVVIELTEDESAWRSGTPGFGYGLVQRIRRRWSRDELAVHIRTKAPESPE